MLQTSRATCRCVVRDNLKSHASADTLKATSDVGSYRLYQQYLQLVQSQLQGKRAALDVHAR
jgi:hypothetical protein